MKPLTANLARTSLRLTGLMLLLLITAFALRPVDSADDSPTAISPSNQEAGKLELIGHYGGYTNAIAVSGNVAVVGKGPELAILELSNPTAPIQVSYLVLTEGITAIEIAGNYAFAAAGKTLSVIDLTDPVMPAEVGTYIAPDTVLAVAVKDNYVYVAADSAGLRVIDISNPSLPVEVASYSSFYSLWGVQVDEQYAFVLIGHSRMLILDISDPTNLAEAGNYQRRSGSFQDFTIEEERAYFTITDVETTHLVEIVDVSDPANPVVMGTLEFSYFYDRIQNIRVFGNYAYVSMGECWGDCAVGLFIVVDVTEPADPVEIAYIFAGDNPSDMVVTEGYAYSAATFDGLQIVQITNPTTPQLVASFGRYLPASEIAVTPQHHAYVLMNRIIEPYFFRSGILTTDVEDPSNPHEVDLHATNFVTHDLDIYEEYLYVVGYGRFDGHLSIYDLKLKGYPVAAGDYYFFYPSSVVVHDKHVYVVSAHEIHKLDITYPTRPLVVESYTPCAYDKKFEIFAGIGYHLCSDGIHFISLNPLQEIATHRIFGNAIFVAGNYAYIAYGQEMSILDITDLTNPVEVGVYRTFDVINEVVVVGTYAYLAEGEGIRVVDVSNLAAPVELAYYFTGGSNEDIKVNGTFAYVVNADTGVYIFRLFALNPTQYLPFAALR